QARRRPPPEVPPQSPYLRLPRVRRANRCRPKRCLSARLSISSNLLSRAQKAVVGQFGSSSGEFTSPCGGIKPPLHQTDPLPIHREARALGEITTVSLAAAHA